MSGSIAHFFKQFPRCFIELIPDEKQTNIQKLLSKFCDVMIEIGAQIIFSNRFGLSVCTISAITKIVILKKYQEKTTEDNFFQSINIFSESKNIIQNSITNVLRHRAAIQLKSAIKISILSFFTNLLITPIVQKARLPGIPQEKSKIHFLSSFVINPLISCAVDVILIGMMKKNKKLFAVGAILAGTGIISNTIFNKPKKDIDKISPELPERALQI